MTALARAIARPTPVAGFGARSPLHGLERRSIGILDLAAQSGGAGAPPPGGPRVFFLLVKKTEAAPQYKTGYINGGAR